MQDFLHRIGRHLDVEKCSYLVNLTTQIMLEICKVDEFYAGPIAQLPPAANIFPIGPERRAVIIQPVSKIFDRTFRRSSDLGADAPGRVVEGVVPHLVRGRMVVV